MSFTIFWGIYLIWLYIVYSLYSSGLGVYKVNFELDLGLNSVLWRLLRSIYRTFYLLNDRSLRSFQSVYSVSVLPTIPLPGYGVRASETGNVGFAVFTGYLRNT